MVLLNLRITYLEETLADQFVNAFLDRIQWAMLNLWDTFFSWRTAVKYLSKFELNWVSWTRMKKVEHKWQ